MEKRRALSDRVRWKWLGDVCEGRGLNLNYGNPRIWVFNRFPTDGRVGSR
jgi:hypothetical protein